MTYRERGSTQLFYHLSLRVLFCLLALAFLNQANANTQQRSDFLKAEKSLRNGDLRLFLKLKQSLTGYPLYPYLEFKELKHNIKKADSNRVDAFLTTYADTPLARPTRKLWLMELASRKKWWPYSVFYQPGLGKKYDCLHLKSQFEMGHKEKLMQGVKTIWLTGRSLPNQCDSVLKIWKDAGHLSNTLVWQRLELAVKARKMGLAKYLIKQLRTQSEQVIAKDWLSALKQPQLILSKSFLKENAPNHIKQKIALKTFKRLIRKDPERADKEWKKVAKRFKFTDGQKYQVRRSLLIAKIKHRTPDTLSELKSFAPNPTDKYFLEKRLRYALTLSEWSTVLMWIKALPAEEQLSERWQYWKARGSAATGRPKTAEKIFQRLSTERSYHGFLSADLLGVDYQLKAIQLPANSKSQKRVESWSGVKRAYELLQLERYTQARREWRMVTQHATKKELTGLAKTAEKWKWHDRAIFTLARTGYWDDLQLRFPLRHRKQVSDKANKHQLKEAWVFAVIRQESAFSADAVSPVGARGLMQLMPKTAAFIAKKINHKPPKRRDLSNPNTNISLGTAYLGSVYSRLGEHQALATAAYNAGPHRVKSWLPENSMAADIWIESIPFTETRRYTERVLYYTTIYESRLGKTATRMSSRIPDIQPERKLAQAGKISVGDAAL